VIGTITAFASTVNRLFSFRMNELVVKYYGEARVKHDHDRAGAVIKAAGLGEITSFVLSFVIVAALAPFAARRLADDPTTQGLFILYGSMVLMNFVTETSTGILQVTNKFRSYAIVNLVSSIVNAGIIVWAFFAKRGMLEVVWAYLIGKAILGLGTAYLGYKEMSNDQGKGWLKAPFSALPPIKELFGFAFSTNISSTIIMLVRDNETL
jgi:O-antigen/teichoic acid export membrane protein